MNVIINNSEPIPMKIIDLRTKSLEKIYLTKHPKDTHSKEELEAVHRAIRYTQLFKQTESLEKMNEEEIVERSMPELKHFYERNKK